MVAKIRLAQPSPSREHGELPVHPGRYWFTVLSGTVLVVLGERSIRVESGQAAEFSTVVPHAFGVDGRPAEIIAILVRTASAPTCARERRGRCLVLPRFGAPLVALPDAPD